MRRSCTHCGLDTDGTASLCRPCLAAGWAPDLGGDADPGLAPTLAGIRRLPPGDLTAALAGAQPGTTFRLAAGRYELTGPVRLSHAVRLEGEGPDATRLVAAPGARLHVHLQDDAALVTLTGLTLEQARAPEAAPVVPTAPTEVLRATAGALTLTDCRLTGGRGLWVGRAARVSLSACAITEADGPGLAVTDEAIATLTGCRLVGNQGFGLQAGHRATLVADACTCEANGRGGVAAEERARLTLVASTITGNGRRGVLVRSSAPCRVEATTIEANAGPGIEVGRAPGLALEANRIRANQGAGVMVGDGARVQAAANACEANAEDGFAVYKGASVRLVGNDARHNGRFGVWVGSGGEAALSDNAADGNQAGEFMAAWSAAIAPEAADRFGRRSDQSSRAAREHLRPGGRYGRR